MKEGEMVGVPAANIEGKVATLHRLVWEFNNIDVMDTTNKKEAAMQVMRLIGGEKNPEHRKELADDFFDSPSRSVKNITGYLANDKAPTDSALLSFFKEYCKPSPALAPAPATIAAAAPATAPAPVAHAEAARAPAAAPATAPAPVAHAEAARAPAPAADIAKGITATTENPKSTLGRMRNFFNIVTCRGDLPADVLVSTKIEMGLQSTTPPERGK